MPLANIKVLTINEIISNYETTIIDLNANNDDMNNGNNNNSKSAFTNEKKLFAIITSNQELNVILH